jgi:hypothetical protein
VAASTLAAEQGGIRGSMAWVRSRDRGIRDTARGSVIEDRRAEPVKEERGRNWDRTADAGANIRTPDRRRRDAEMAASMTRDN